MNWAAEHVRRLRAGETVSFRPVGNSMQPIYIGDIFGRLVSVRP